jgi:hypothetical protein
MLLIWLNMNVSHGHWHLDVLVSQLNILIRRYEPYFEFCRMLVIAVLIGDITDAKHEDLEGSEQFKDEWQSYQKVIRESRILERTVWLDVRGNHGTCHHVVFVCLEPLVK